MSDFFSSASLPRHVSYSKKSSRFSRVFYGMGAKRCFDFVVALVALVLAAPVLASLCLMILAVQGGPAIFAQRRVGRDGKVFYCYKFRTMVTNADEMLSRHLASNPQAREDWRNTRKLKVDPRVTSLGRVMRKTSIDELPQIINVLKGDMSLVGPRPIVSEEVPLYGADIKAYYCVRPGLTGAWQTERGQDFSFAERIEIDVDYVARQSFLTDLAIILKTIPVLLTSRGCY